MNFGEWRSARVPKTTLTHPETGEKDCEGYTYEGDYFIVGRRINSRSPLYVACKKGSVLSRNTVLNDLERDVWMTYARRDLKGPNNYRQRGGWLVVAGSFVRRFVDKKEADKWAVAMREEVNGIIYVEKV